MVLRLEAHCLLPREAHGEEREAVSIHLVSGILADTEANAGLDLNEPKIRFNEFARLQQGRNSIDDVSVPLPEIGGDVLARGKHAAAFGVDDGGVTDVDDQG